MIDKNIKYGKFRFGIVNDDNVLKDTFGMRYEVYVDEFGFEKKEGGILPDDGTIPEEMNGFHFHQIGKPVEYHGRESLILALLMRLNNH